MGKVYDMISSAMTADNVRMFILGEKKNGKPRAMYDIAKDIIFDKDYGKKRRRGSSISSRKKKKGKSKTWKFK